MQTRRTDSSHIPETARSRRKTRGPAEGRPARHGAATPPARPLRILLAEDTPANRKVITAILSLDQHDVTVARDGHEVVELYRRGTFDVILMDVKMPGRDGYEAAAMIRALERASGRRTAIVALTASTRPEDGDRCRQADMDDHLPKPIDADALRAKVLEAAAWTYPDDDLPIAACSLAAPCEPAGESPDNSADRLVANFDAALARMGGNRQLLADVADYFLEDAPHLLRQIREQAGRGETAEMRRAAHSLRGLAANFDAASAIEAAYHVERGDAATLTRDPAPLDRLQREVDRLQEALTTYRTATRS